PMVEGLKRVEKGVDKTASELAIVRLNKEMSELRVKRVGLQESREQERNHSLLGGVLMPIIGIFVIASFQGHWLAWLFGLALIASGIYSGLYEGFRLFSESDEEVQVCQQINNKKEELARHQQIVKS